MTNMCCNTCKDFLLYDDDRYDVYSAGECKRIEVVLTIRQQEDWKLCWRNKEI